MYCDSEREKMLTVAECRHKMRPSVQLLSVRGIDSNQAPGGSGSDCTLGQTIINCQTSRRHLGNDFETNNARNLLA